MKIMHVERLMDEGGFSASPEWQQIETHIRDAIKAVQWPAGSGSFTLFDQPGKGRGQGSGVKPIKEACMLHLKSQGWRLGAPIAIPGARKLGPLDAAYPVWNRLFCVEWETGNISSSHRAINKMALGILEKVLIGGLLILPTRSMYKYLTDRVGNLSEIEPYFPLWRSLRPDEGLLVIMAIEHDAVSSSVPRIPKGTDGRALQ